MQEKLAPLLQQHPGLPARLEDIARAAYLVHERNINLNTRDLVTHLDIFERDMDDVLSALETYNADQATGTRVIEMYQTKFRNSTLLVTGRRIEDQFVDLDSFSDRLLIASMAFQNYCRLACRHCGIGGKWDQREQHSLLELEKALPKIRFPRNSHVSLTGQEPFTVPFLMEAVELLLAHGAGVAVVTSGLGVPRSHRHYLMRGLSYLNARYPGRVKVDISFDLFRRAGLDAYLRNATELLDSYPVVSDLKVNFFQENKEATRHYLRRLFNLVSTPGARALVFKALENIEHPQNSILYLGNASGLFEDADFHHSISLLYSGHGRYFRSYASPQALPFMLMAGGDVAPECDFASTHFKSLGNILTDSPRDIYQKYLSFQTSYERRIAAGEAPYPALVLTERERRSSLGLSPVFVTHFDTLARKMVQSDRVKESSGQEVNYLHYFDLLKWIKEGLASWEGVKLSRDKLKQFYLPLCKEEIDWFLQSDNYHDPATFSPDIYQLIVLLTDMEIATYEELGVKKEELEANHRAHLIYYAAEAYKDVAAGQEDPGILKTYLPEIRGGLYSFADIGTTEKAFLSFITPDNLQAETRSGILERLRENLVKNI